MLLLGDLQEAEQKSRCSIAPAYARPTPGLQHLDNQKGGQGPRLPVGPTLC